MDVPLGYMACLDILNCTIVNSKENDKQVLIYLHNTLLATIQ